MYGNWKIVVISLNAISLLSLLFIQLYFVICIFYWGKEFSHGKELMQITEFLRLIGGLYYYSYSCITKKWITWIYAEKLHFETFFLQDEPLLLHSKLNQAQHGKSRIQTKLKEWMVENIIKGHLRRRNMRMIFSPTQIEYTTLWSDRNTF